MIKEGIDSELDELRNISRTGKDFILDIENKEKELHDRIANMILQNIKCYREDVEEYEQEQEDELYIDNTSETVFEHAKVSMKNRSRCLEGGVLDELAKELAKTLNLDISDNEFLNFNVDFTYVNFS